MNKMWADNEDAGISDEATGGVGCPRPHRMASIEKQKWRHENGYEKGRPKDAF